MPRESCLTLEALEALKAKLTALPHKQVYAKKEAIAYLQEEIRGLLEKNYSMPEIAALLMEGGLEIAPATLGRFLNERNRNGRKKSNPGRRNSTSEKPPAKKKESNAISEETKGIDAAPSIETGLDKPLEKAPEVPEKENLEKPEIKGGEAEEKAPEKNEAPQPDNAEKERKKAGEQKTDPAEKSVEGKARIEESKGKPKNTGFAIREDTEDL